MDYSLYPRNDVLCIDMRSFYASVEAMKLGKDPMKVMLAVVGDPNRPGSIVLAASPTLKKRYGISNVSRYFELPNDPNIIIVPAHMGDYLKVSIEITKLLHDYAPPEAIHQYSIDEVWVTLNGLQKLFGSPWDIAQKIQNEILDRFGITSSIGIGDNKFLAKVVMDLHAKKTGIAECRYEDVPEKLWPTPVQNIWGIGHRMMKNLHRMGIVTLGQIANYKLEHLQKRFGVMGEQLYWHAWGIDLSPVFGDFTKHEQKGFGHGIALLRDYSSEEVAYCILDLCEEACRRARTAGKAGRTIQLSISYSKDTAGGFSRSRSVDIPTNVTMDMYDVCMKLFHEFYDGKSMIRHVNVGLTKLYDKEDADIQLDLFEDRTKKNDIGYVMDSIRARFGSTAILRASSYTDAGVTLERSKKIGGHYA
ncbi:UV damage repair protein UvrX [Paenibacillus sp. 7884-2]|nr:UV damage repair protein UvrX [Paenibacillus sp. 7884-2]